MDFEKAVKLFFEAGVSPNLACGIIRCTYPQATCDEVDSCYQRFMGNAPVIPKPKPKEAEPKTLTDLPEEVLSMIADNLNATDIKNMKVSSKHTLEYLNTDRVYSLIHLHMDSEKILLVTSGSELDESKRSLKMRETFLKEDNSRGDENGGRPRQESRYPSVDKAIKLLEDILDRQGVKILRLHINVVKSRTTENEQIERYFLERIQRTMAGLRSLINVEEFKIDTQSAFPIRGFLICLKPGTLKHAHMYSADTTNMMEIVTLPQWRYLQFFAAMNVSNLLLESIPDSTRINVDIPTITPGEVDEYKKNLLTKHSSFFYTFHIKNNYPLADCLKQLEPYRPIGVEEGKGYFLLNNQKRCYFQLRNNSMKFSTILI